MSKHLVIVESPAKARTLKKYLGRDYEVLASYGHVRDLVPKEGAVDTDNGFAMRYAPIEKNEKHVDTIRKAAKKADALYLATDPDREGEAISWHLYELLREQGLVADKTVGRVVFHEVTERAIQEAVAHPRELSMDLINAQQARRALDYLVGFNLSPLLWKKVRRGLSAGRVQSPALRLIAEREEEIERFQTREYWSLEADAEKDAQRFVARLTHYHGAKIEQFSFDNGDAAHAARKALEQAASGRLVVSAIERKSRKRNPAPPFTTSTLQQEASRKLGFTASRTMRVAQSLYEGVDIGEGTVGLITYMRTDSVNLAQEAIEELRAAISERYGADQVPKRPNLYKTKSKNAQEAHEAIRPTSAWRAPDTLKAYLSADQIKLYDLVWKRAVACQMRHALLDTVAADLGAGKEHTLRATGSTLVEPGFLAVYQEGVDDAAADEEGGALPPLAKGDAVQLNAMRAEQHFTEPPPRYSEASLVKALEEFGIGRPSTYASIISTLQSREYVELDKRRFRPTDVGRIVSRFLSEHFTQYVDYHFTARLEDELDAVSRGEKDWVPVMQHFWTPFKALVVDKDENLKRSDVTHEKLDEACPKCGKPLSIRLGRRGRFIGCGGYPDCDYTRNLGDDKDAAPTTPEVVEGRVCPQCESQLIVRSGRYGKFIGCSAYPKCKFIEPLEKPADTGIACAKCAQGTLLKRKSRYGKIFFSCARYPDCDYAVWNEPVAKPCPKCHWPLTTVKTTKRRGTELVCPQKQCGYAEPYGEAAPADDQ
jgi:DNA topoisomerase-1